MKDATSKNPKSSRSKYYEEFKPIKDSPENVAKAIMQRPPKKDWNFMKPKSAKIK